MVPPPLLPDLMLMSRTLPSVPSGLIHKAGRGFFRAVKPVLARELAPVTDISLTAELATSSTMMRAGADARGASGVLTNFW